MPLWTCERVAHSIRNSASAITPATSSTWARRSDSGAAIPLQLEDHLGSGSVTYSRGARRAQSPVELIPYPSLSNRALPHLEFQSGHGFQDAHELLASFWSACTQRNDPTPTDKKRAGRGPTLSTQLSLCEMDLHSTDLALPKSGSKAEQNSAEQNNTRRFWNLRCSQSRCERTEARARRRDVQHFSESKRGRKVGERRSSGRTAYIERADGREACGGSANIKQRICVRYEPLTRHRPGRTSRPNRRIRVHRLGKCCGTRW